MRTILVHAIRGDDGGQGEVYFADWIGNGGSQRNEHIALSMQQGGVQAAEGDKGDSPQSQGNNGGSRKARSAGI
jgi:hypothetical protein